MLSNMSGAFETIDTQEINAHLDRGHRMANGRTLVEDYAICCLEFGYIVLDQASGLDDLDVLIDDHLRVLAIRWRRECRKDRQVYSEWSVGH